MILYMSLYSTASLNPSTHDFITALTLLKNIYRTYDDI